MKDSDLEALDEWFGAECGKGPVHLARALRAYIGFDRSAMREGDAATVVALVGKYFPLNDDALWSTGLGVDTLGVSERMPPYTCATLLFGLDIEAPGRAVRYVTQKETSPGTVDAVVDAPLIELRSALAYEWSPTVLLKTLVVALERGTLDRIRSPWSAIATTELVGCALGGWPSHEVLRAAQCIAHGNLGKVVLGGSPIMRALIAHNSEQSTDIVARVILADTTHSDHLARWIPTAMECLMRHPRAVCRAVTRRLAVMSVHHLNDDLADRVNAMITMVDSFHIHCVFAALQDMRLRAPEEHSNSGTVFIINAFAILRANRNKAPCASSRAAPMCS